MIYTMIFIIIFLFTYALICYVINKYLGKLEVGNIINLGLLLIAVITVSISIYSFNSWKSQYYLNNKEKLLIQISDQLEKTDNQFQTYQRLLHNFSQNPQINSREAIFYAYYATEFDLNKLKLLLKKSSKEIEAQCTNLHITALATVNNLLINQITSYSKVETTLFNTIDNPYNQLSSQAFKNEQNNLLHTNSELNNNWRGLSNAILVSTIKLSGDKKLEDSIKSDEPCQLSDFTDMK